MEKIKSYEVVIEKHTMCLKRGFIQWTIAFENTTLDVLNCGTYRIQDILYNNKFDQKLSLNLLGKVF